MLRLLAILALCLLPTLTWAGEPISSYAERESLGDDRYRTTIHSAPIAYQENGQWKRIVSDWTDGDASYPQVVTRSRLRVRTASDGMRRILPVIGDDTKYLEIGAPLVKNVGGDWIKPSFAGPVRSGNKLTWTNAQATMTVTHYGHGIKLDIELLGGYVPRDSQFAFPVGINGLTRSGAQILDGSTVVMLLRPPNVYDAANPPDMRQIAWEFVNVSGQTYILFTLPSLDGMSRPTVDPTVTLQPANRDNYMMQYLADTNRGTYQTFEIGEGNNAAGRVSRTLIDFTAGLSSIPDVFTSATLYLYVTGDLASSGPAYVIYLITQAWGEETSTWNTYNGVNAWPGGAGAGGDIGTAIGGATFTDAETLNTFLAFPLTVKSKAALGILGWLIKSTAEANDQYTFSSSNNAAPSTWPKLVVEYANDYTPARWNRMLGPRKLRSRIQ